MPAHRTLKRMTALLACFYMVIASPAFAEEKTTKLSAEALSLSITRPVPGAKQGSEIAQFNGQEGTEVKLFIQAKGKQLVELDKDQSKVSAFTDDKGNSLISGKGFGSFEGFSWLRVSDDGKLATIDVSGRKTPGKGATALLIKGKLVFQVASKQSTHRHAKLALVKGSKVSAGPMKGIIKNAGKPRFGNSAWSVTMEFKGKLPPIAEVRFLDAQGKVIKSSQSSSSRTKIFNAVTTTYTYNLDQKVPAATIEYVVWDDMQTVELPLDMKVDMGG